MLFWAVTLKNVWRRKLRTMLTVVALVVSVSATTALLSVAWGYASSATGHYTERQVDIVVVRAGVAERITSTLNAGLAPRLRRLPGVAKVDGSLREMVSLGEGLMIGIPLHGLDPAGFTLQHYTLSQGRLLRPDDRRAVLLGEGLAKSLNATPGQPVEIEGTQFDVVGIYEAADALESNTAVASLADLQVLMDRPEQVSEFQIQLTAPADETKVREMCRELERLKDDEGHALGLKAMAARDFAASDTETGLLNAMAWGTSLIAIGLSTLGILNTMLMSVAERTREFGILRAIGWSRRRVIRLIVCEALVICVASAAIGLVVAWGVVQLLAMWSFTRTLVPPVLAPAAAGLGAAVGLLAGVAGALYPAYWAASVAPTEALHYE